MRHWYVLETACYPAKWKVTYDTSAQKDMGRNDKFFSDIGEAQTVADFYNRTEQ